MNTLKSFDALKEYKPEFNQPVEPVSTPTFDAVMAHRSGSNRCMNYLSSLAGDSIELTANELAEKAGTTIGAASGFVSRLVKLNIADYGAGHKGRMTYHIDLLMVKDGVNTKNMRGRGRIPGTTMDVESRRRATSMPRDEPLILQSATAFESIPAALRHYADLLEAKPSLSAFSDEDIIAELKRRLSH